MSTGTIKFIRRVGLPIVVGLAAAALMVGLVRAASTSKSLSTNFTLVNLGSSPANVAVSYYKENGSAWTADAANSVFTITANGGQKIVYQYFDTTLTSGRGSVVVSSDQPLGALAQIVARNQTPTSGAYSGFNQGSTTFYLPLLSRRGSSASGTTNSQIIIQNADTTAADVTVQLSPSSGFTGSYTKTITSLQPGASYYYDLDDETNLSVTPWFGSAVVTAASSKKVTVISNFFLGPDGMQTYNGFPSGSLSTAWIVPLFYSRLPNNLSSPIAIQNLSGGSIAAGGIQAACTTNAGSTPATFTMTNTVAIPNGQGFNFNPVVDMTIPGNWQGSCRVTASGSIVLITLPRFLGTGNNAAYEGLNANSTDKRVFGPLVAKRLSNGFSTTLSIQNLSATLTATVVLTYTPSPDYVAGGGSSALLTTSTQISPDGTLVQNQRLSSFTVGATPMPDGWFGTLVAVSSNQPIAGIAQNTNYLSPPGDTYFSYVLFSQP